MQGEFPQTVSYNRFVELMEKEALSMAVILKMFCLGECTGISYVDSTPLRVCKNITIPRHHHLHTPKYPANKRPSQHLRVSFLNFMYIC